MMIRLTRFPFYSRVFFRQAARALMADPNSDFVRWFFGAEQPTSRVRLVTFPSDPVSLAGEVLTSQTAITPRVTLP
jgi:hypothetical protein